MLPIHHSTMQLQALDLFCGAGGASAGLALAGFQVTGIDHRKQPRYPYRFIQADALQPPLDLAAFDLVWTSPPCQRYSVASDVRTDPERYPDLVGRTRRLLEQTGVRYWIIENVPKAPIRADAVLRGIDFGLPIVRRRHFELCGFQIPFRLTAVEGRRVSTGQIACVAGRGANNGLSRTTRWLELPKSLRERILRRNSADGWRQAMETPWMTRSETAQAVPPAYARYLGDHAHRTIEGDRTRSGRIA